MISFPCPKCTKSLTTREELAGKKVRCPKCRSGILVPMGMKAPLAGSDSASGKASVVHLPVSSENGHALRLVLEVRDKELADELRRFKAGVERDEFALAALRVGVLSMRHASSEIDSHTIRREGEKLLGSLRDLMTSSSERFHEVLSATLRKYFDPNDGDLRQRLDRLLTKDGELQSVLALHLEGDDSTIARTLARHVGQQSPLFRLLSPSQSDGLLSTLTDALQHALQSQREHILREFSLNDKDSALSRLISELCEVNGRLRADLCSDLTKLEKEFSLDNPAGALCRLVARVDNAQQCIVDQFSQDNDGSALNRLSRLIQSANESIQSRLTLDDENSPLYRLRRELLHIIENMEKGNTDFQKEVLSSLASFKARREEIAKSTRRGGEFEDAVGSFLQDDAQKRGDLLEATGNRAGSKPYCKVGDHVLTLGPESAAPGGRIVFESKEDKSYDLARAQKEIEEARHNRNAQVGVFVFSKATAPHDLEPFARYGPDILVVWDKEDAATDVFLKVALSVARALVIREKMAEDRAKLGLNKVKKCLNALTRNIDSLEQFTKWSTSIKSNAERMLDRVPKIQADLEKQLAVLKEHVADLEQAEETHAGA